MLDMDAQRELPVVLLIDDDLVSREVTATLLTMSGYTVHTAENGDAGLAMVDAGAVRPGVILTDAQMPGLNGTELIRRLRTASRDALLYIVSGSRPPEEMVAAADGLLLKPFNPETLKRMIEGKATQAAPSFVDPDEPVVSVEVLRQLRQLMPESAVRQIFTAMVADLKGRIEALGVAISRHDAAEARRIGHAIKGGCGMAGAMQAARLGALLETEPLEPVDNQLDNSRALLRDLRAAAWGLERILDGELPA